jgi:D-glycero-alpha-D-manno-heptose-7-phosphate kinase
MLLLQPKIASRELTIVRARAPLRISFAGGGTDVPPYPERFGGCVLSATIGKYAYVSLRDTESPFVRAICEEQGVDAVFAPAGDCGLQGKMDLAEAIVRRFSVSGLECHINADAPPGSGLGSSSTMIVALIEGLARRCGVTLSRYEKATLAFDIERNDLGIVGGMQDQYAAAFGGFNFIEFTKDEVCVTPLRLNADAIADLHMHLLLCYTGATRFSGAILKEQISNVVHDDPDVMASLCNLKALTLDLKTSLLKARLYEFGDLLNEAWKMKRKLASSITNDKIDEVYEEARRAGSLGGKLLGAGGGGHMLFFVPFNRRLRVREAMQRSGMSVVDFQFEDQGASSWLSSNRTWA